MTRRKAGREHRVGWYFRRPPSSSEDQTPVGEDDSCLRRLFTCPSKHASWSDARKSGGQGAPHRTDTTCQQTHTANGTTGGKRWDIRSTQRCYGVHKPCFDASRAYLRRNRCRRCSTHAEAAGSKLKPPHFLAPHTCLASLLPPLFPSQGPQASSPRAPPGHEQTPKGGEHPSGSAPRSSTPQRRGRPGGWRSNPGSAPHPPASPSRPRDNTPEAGGAGGGG